MFTRVFSILPFQLIKAVVISVKSKHNLMRDKNTACKVAICAAEKELTTSSKANPADIVYTSYKLATGEPIGRGASRSALWVI